MHTLVCEDHKDANDSKDLLERYKQRCIENFNLPPFAKNISLSFHANGCYNDFIVKLSRSAVNMLGKNAEQESSRTIQIDGVGNTAIQSTLCTYNVKIPMHNGKIASLSGICMEEITTTCPQYTLEDAFKNICESYSSIGDCKDFPVPSATVDGDIHFMLGSSDDLKLSEAQLSEIDKKLDIHHFIAKNSTTMTEVHQRYEFSQYLIDPNRHRFSLVNLGGTPHLKVIVPLNEFEYAKNRLFDEDEDNDSQEYFMYVVETLALPTPSNLREVLHM
eukprot:gene17168-18890_t